MSIVPIDDRDRRAHIHERPHGANGKPASGTGDPGLLALAPDSDGDEQRERVRVDHGLCTHVDLARSNDFGDIGWVVGLCALSSRVRCGCI